MLEEAAGGGEVDGRTRALSEIDMLTFSLGIGLGLVVGSIPIPIPGGMSIQLGFAGGPLIVALILGALGAVLVLTLLALIAASPLMRLFGARVEAVITRLLGVLLAALAAQYVIDGLRASFGL